MKIVISANTSWYLFNFRKNLIRAIIQEGHRVYVISPPDKYVDKLLQLGVEYYPLHFSQRGMNPFMEIILCIKLFRLLKKIQPDIALTFTVKCNLYFGLCQRLLKFKQICNVSGLGEVFEKKDLLSLLVSQFYKYALVDSRHVFFQNYEDMVFLLKDHIIPEHLCTRLPGSGVDLETFHPVPYFQSNKPRIFLIFGRIVPKKGYDLLIRAAQNMQLDKHRTAEFWIMGIVDNSRRESLMLFEKIMEMHKKGVVKYIPPTDDVTSVLNQVDVVVLPSTYNEGVPRSLLEAMAYGKPIITTDWKGCRDTVEHGVNGYLIQPDNLIELEYYIRKLSVISDKKLYEMGQASREKAEMEFDENLILNTYLQKIEDIETMTIDGTRLLQNTVQ